MMNGGNKVARGSCSGIEQGGDIMRRRNDCGHSPVAALNLLHCGSSLHKQSSSLTLLAVFFKCGLLYLSTAVECISRSPISQCISRSLIYQCISHSQARLFFNWLILDSGALLDSMFDFWAHWVPANNIMVAPMFNVCGKLERMLNITKGKAEMN